MDLSKVNEESCIVIGNFNADLNRNKRFDKYLNNYLRENGLVACENLLEQSELNYTYKKCKTMRMITTL